MRSSFQFIKYSLELIVVVAIGVLIFVASSQETYAAEAVASGTCGNNVTWILDDEGTLTISGSGKMTDFATTSQEPWYSNRSDVTKVVIVSGVTSIGNYAFDEFSSLKTVTIPTSVKSIGDNAFFTCYSLKNITIPDGVTRIGKNAFFLCYSLNSVAIGSGVTVIDNAAFHDCDSLTSIVIPDSVETIGVEAFKSCNSLQTATLGNGITTIGSEAFADCINLKKVFINDLYSWTNIIFSNYQSNPLCLGAALYLGNELVENLMITGNISSISPYSFYGCSSIKTVFISEGVLRVGRAAFSKCANITNVSIPSSVKSIENGAFDQCEKLNKVYISDLIAWFNIVFGGGNANPLSNKADLFLNNVRLETIVIPDVVTAIGAYTFYNCSSLKDVAFHDGITSIGNSAFAGCSEIENITVYDGVTSIERDAFHGCSNLKRITLPDSVTFIGSYAFCECGSLTSICIPNKITTIEEFTFLNCLSLKTVMIPDCVTRIEYMAFNNCISLANVKLPNSLTMLGGGTFYGCSSLESIVIPAGVSSIGDYAFSGCSNLKYITIPDSVNEIDVRSFKGISSDYLVYTVQDSYASRYFDASHVQYLCEPEQIEERSILGFSVDRIVLSENDSVLLSDYLITNTDFADCTVCVSDESLFYYDDGIIVALGEGQGSLTVSNDNLSATIALISTSETVDATEMVLNESAIPMKKGEKEFLAVTLSPTNATNSIVNWASSDPSIVTVDNGLITAVGSGTAMVTASLAGNAEIMATCEVTVSIPLQSIITFEGTDPYSIQTGKTKQLLYYLYPSNTTDSDLSFNSSDSNIISIDENGTMTANDNGTVLISISNGEINKTVSVTAYTPLSGLSLNCSTVRTCCGNTFNLVAMFEPANTSEKDVVWSSSKEAVATVDKDGFVTVHGNGIATIMATAGDYSATCVVVCNSHNWDGGIITTEPSCLEEGVKTFTCVCGDTYTESVSATGHSFSEKYTIDLEPTCTEQGLKSKHCENCDEVIETTEIHALGHAFGDWEETIPSTCDVSGVSQRSCSRCGFSESKLSDPKGHDVNDYYTIDVPVTCTTDGSQSRHCKKCDAIFNSEVIPAQGHSYGDWVQTKESTCSEIGLKEKQCEVCGNKLIEEIPLKKHLWNSEPTIDKMETCTIAGSRSIHCARCNTIKEGTVEAIPATGHHYSEWTTIKAATEIAAGKKTHKCTVCGQSETAAIAQLVPTLISVKISKPKKGKKSATIKWKKVSKKNQKKIGSIQIQYSLDKSFTSDVKTVTAKKSAKSKKIKKLISKKTYYVRIRAYKASGGAVHVSDWSAIKSVNVK